MEGGIYHQRILIGQGIAIGPVGLPGARMVIFLHTGLVERLVVISYEDD